MSRLALFILACALFVSKSLTFAFTSPGVNGELVKMEKNHTFSGIGTWYEVGAGLCGYTDSDSDPVLSISPDLYGNGENCNQWVHIVDVDNANEAYGKVRDLCESCGLGSIDMSPSLFEEFASLATGEIKVRWNFINGEP